MLVKAAMSAEVWSLAVMLRAAALRGASTPSSLQPGGFQGSQNALCSFVFDASRVQNLAALSLDDKFSSLNLPFLAVDGYIWEAFLDRIRELDKVVDCARSVLHQNLHVNQKYVAANVCATDCVIYAYGPDAPYPEEAG